MTEARMIFVAGNSRSGTTALSRILGAHPSVHTFPELHFVEELWRPGRLEALGRAEIARLLQNADGGYLQRLDAARYEHEAEHIFDVLGMDASPWDAFKAVISSRISPHATIACEQTPKNVYYVANLLAAFPDALVVIIVRDPRDVILSQKKWWKHAFNGGTFPWRSIPWSITARRWADYHPLLTGALWVGGARAGDAYRDHPRVITVRFEDLVARPVETIEALTAAAGLDFIPDMLAVPRRNSSHAADAPLRVGLDPSAVGNWRRGLTKAEVWVAERVVFPTGRTWGYRPSGERMPITAIGVYALLPVKMTLSFLLRLNRLRDFVGALALRFKPR